MVDELPQPLGPLPRRLQRLTLRERAPREFERGLPARAPRRRRLALERGVGDLLPEQDAVEPREAVEEDAGRLAEVRADRARQERERPTRLEDVERGLEPGDVGLLADI